MVLCWCFFWLRIVCFLVLWCYECCVWVFCCNGCVVFFWWSVCLCFWFFLVFCVVCVLFVFVVYVDWLVGFVLFLIDLGVVLMVDGWFWLFCILDIWLVCGIIVFWIYWWKWISFWIDDCVDIVNWGFLCWIRVCDECSVKSDFVNDCVKFWLCGMGVLCY